MAFLIGWILMACLAIGILIAFIVWFVYMWEDVTSDEENNEDTTIR
jgi:uncharacterized membrane protein